MKRGNKITRFIPVGATIVKYFVLHRYTYKVTKTFYGLVQKQEVNTFCVAC